MRRVFLYIGWGALPFTSGIAVLFGVALLMPHLIETGRRDTTLSVSGLILLLFFLLLRAILNRFTLYHHRPDYAGELFFFCGVTTVALAVAAAVHYLVVLPVIPLRTKTIGKIILFLSVAWTLIGYFVNRQSLDRPADKASFIAGALLGPITLFQIIVWLWSRSAT